MTRFIKLESVDEYPIYILKSDITKVEIVDTIHMGGDDGEPQVFDEVVKVHTADEEYEVRGDEGLAASIITEIEGKEF